MELRDLKGKVIKYIDYDVYRTSLHIYFEDGTTLAIGTGSTGMHNDRWSTVEFKIHEPEK